MPVTMGFWELTQGGELGEIEVEPFPGKEEGLEEAVERNPRILGEDLLIIGRQTPTSSGVMDLLGLDREANVVVVELKQAGLPREVIAQALDYASWIAEQDPEAIERVAEKYLGGSDVQEAFSERFGGSYEELVCFAPRILIVGSDVSEPVERMIGYLGDYGIDINWVVVQSFPVAETRCVSSVRIAPAPKEPPEPHFLSFLTSVRERTRERIGEFFEGFHWIAKVPKKWLGFAPQEGLGFNISPYRERKAIYLNFSVSRDKPDYGDVLSGLREHEKEIKEKLGTEPTYNWSSGPPIQEYIPWSGKREDLTVEMVEKVVDRLCLYITTLLPLLPSEPLSEGEEEATG